MHHSSNKGCFTSVIDRERILPVATHNRPVVFEFNGWKPNNDASYDVIPDSDDLKSRADFSPYLCHFPWQMRQRHESWPLGVRTIVGFRPLQSLRASRRSIRLHPLFRVAQCKPAHGITRQHLSSRPWFVDTDGSPCWSRAWQKTLRRLLHLRGWIGPM